jgi:hypothetical protein
MPSDDNPIEAEIVIEREDGSQTVIRKWKEPKTSAQKQETAHYERFKRADDQTNKAVQAVHGLDWKRKLAKKHRHLKKRFRQLAHRTSPQESLSAPISSMPLCHQEPESIRFFLRHQEREEMRQRMQELGISEILEYVQILVRNEALKAGEASMRSSSINH